MTDVGCIESSMLLHDSTMASLPDPTVQPTIVASPSVLGDPVHSVTALVVFGSDDQQIGAEVDKALGLQSTNSKLLTPSKRSLPCTPVRTSKRREATIDENSLERAEHLVAIRNLEEPPLAGKVFKNSILTVSDSTFSSNIQSVGIFMG